MKELWDNRFSGKEYFYGETPNLFLKDFLDNYTLKNVLCAGEGEGRNAVYAALRGCRVFAFDLSEVAKVKAMALAEAKSVKLAFTVADIMEYEPEQEGFDAIISSFMHLPPAIRKAAHHRLVAMLNVGGYIAFEMFSKKQLGRDSGGPQNVDLLYDETTVREDFADLKTVLLKEEIVELDEGDMHQGAASVIRYIGQRTESTLRN